MKYIVAVDKKNEKIFITLQPREGAQLMSIMELTVVQKLFQMCQNFDAEIPQIVAHDEERKLETVWFFEFKLKVGDRDNFLGQLIKLESQSDDERDRYLLEGDNIDAIIANMQSKRTVERDQSLTLGDDASAPVCDCCNKSISWEDGYVLTTAQVVTNKAYWINAFKGPWSWLNGMESDQLSIFLIPTIVRQTQQSTGWFVCELCSKHYVFDSTAAKQYACSRQTNPLGSGTFDNRELVIQVACQAWEDVFGSWPSCIPKKPEVIVPQKLTEAAIWPEFVECKVFEETSSQAQYDHVFTIKGLPIQAGATLDPSSNLYPSLVLYIKEKLIWLGLQEDLLNIQTFPGEIFISIPGYLARSIERQLPVLAASSDASVDVDFYRVDSSALFESIFTRTILKDIGQLLERVVEGRLIRRNKKVEYIVSPEASEETKEKHRQLLEKIMVGRIQAFNLVKYDFSSSYSYYEHLEEQEELGSITNLITLPDGRLVHAGQGGLKTKIWDTYKGKCIQNLVYPSPFCSVEAFVLSPDGKLISKHDVGGINVWDTETGECLQTLKVGQEGLQETLAIFSDGRLITSGCNSNLDYASTVTIWDLQVGGKVGTYVIGSAGYGKVVATCGGRLIVGGRDRISIYSLIDNENKLYRWCSISEDGIGNLSVLLPTETFQFVAGFSGGIIKKWSALDPYECLQTLEGHHKRIRALVLHPNGQLVSASDDKSIKLWDLETDRCVQTLEGHTKGVQALTVLHDGRIVSGSKDETMRVWGTQLHWLLEILKGNSSVQEVIWPEIERDDQCLKREMEKVVARNILLSDKLLELKTKLQEGQEELREQLYQEKDALFFLAARAGNLILVELLKQLNPNIVLIQSQYGTTALHLAVFFQHNVDLVQLLLEDLRVNIDAQDSRDWTPLHVAASQGNLEIARLLLLFGARTDLKTKEDQTALKLAQEISDNPVTILLAEAKKSPPSLFMDYPGFSEERITNVFFEMQAYFIRKKLGKQTSYEIKLGDFTEVLLLLRNKVLDEELEQYAKDHGFRHAHLLKRNDYHDLRARIIKLPRDDRQEAFGKYIAYLQHIYAYLQAVSLHSSRRNLLTELEISTQVLTKLEMLPQLEQSETAEEESAASPSLVSRG
jgi:WD40 repeat protein